MHFAFTDEQQMLADAVADMLSTACTPDHLRTAWTADDGLVPGLWAALAAMGVPAVCVAGAHGGLGLAPVDAALVLAACGYAGVPDPIVETALVAPPLLSAAGRTEDLARLAAGELVVSMAPADQPFLPHAPVADVLIVAGRRAERGGEPFAAEFDPAKVSLERVESVDGARRLFRATVDRGMGASAHLLTDDGDVIDRALAAGQVGMACVLLGLSQRMLDLTVAYVTKRRQFGVPIGSFQAVKHHCADALVALDMAKPVVWRAAWSLSHPDDAGDAGPGGVLVHAAMAKAFANDAAAEVARQALQCHAAIGYTTEYDLHLYMKRAWALTRAWGDSATCRRTVAAAVL